MNIITHIKLSFIDYLQRAFSINLQLANKCAFSMNVDPLKQQFGDLTTNAAMVLAKHQKKNPREIAEKMRTEFKSPFIQKLEIAGPGFINAYLTHETFVQLAQELFEEKDNFFKPELAATTQPTHTNPSGPQHVKRYVLEFVSANPTGPLHLGHGRNAILGDVLGNVLRFLGYDVIKEFYLNDAGVQITKLGNALKIRVQQALGHDVALPEDSYHGQYLADLAEECIKEYGQQVLEKPDSFFQDYAKSHLQKQIKETLEQYGVVFDEWFSEKNLHRDGSIDHAIQYLKKHGHLYEQDGALWFASSEFGDDKDRVIRKKDGQWTYAAADIAYMLNKIARGADHLIMVLGHDHHSYAVRLQNFKKALKLDQTPLDIILYQLVKIKEGEKQLQMSKRAGRQINLHDIIDAVGSDVARFFYLHRKPEAQLEFDLELALKDTNENPVYYVQYAYVRTKSMLEKAQQEPALQNIEGMDLEGIGNAEYLLLKKIASLKGLLETISNNLQTHLLSYYLIELADIFHNYYAHNRVIELEDIPKSRARLALIITLRNTFGLVLKLLGISLPEKM